MFKFDDDAKAVADHYKQKSCKIDSKYSKVWLNKVCLDNIRDENDPAHLNIIKRKLMPRRREVETRIIFVMQSSRFGSNAQSRGS